MGNRMEMKSLEKMDFFLAFTILKVANFITTNML